MTQEKFKPRKFFDPSTESDAHYAFWDDELVDMINVSIAIRRPLLLTGEPGVGKTSVARAVAAAKKWAFLKETIRSRSEADELKSTFDAVGRLSDSSGGGEPKDTAHYVWPNILWQAFAPNDARAFLKANGGRMNEDLEKDSKASGRAVLIDEIDKGDLDFANDLLDAFDEGNFKDPHTKRQINRENSNELFIAITSNAERDLSPAFERRCIPYQMKAPSIDLAVAIGEQHILHREFDHKSKKKSPPRFFKPKEHLPRLAALSHNGGHGHDGKLNVATYVDLIDAMLEFQPLKRDWEDFIKAMTAFSRSRTNAAD